MTVRRSLPPWAVYALLFAAAWILRLAYLAELSGHPSFLIPLVDAGEYHSIARLWAQGPQPLDKLSWQPWFYPVVLAQLYQLSGPSIWAAKLLQITAGALTCVLTAALAFALWPRPAIRWIAGLAAAFYGPLIFFDGELLAEPWAALWLTAAALVACHYRRTPRTLLALALGALGALLLFTRPPAFVGWLPLAVWAALAWRRRADAWKTALSDFLLLVVGFALTATPFLHAVQKATGSARLLPATGGINLYIGNSARPCETLSIRPGYAWENLMLWPELHGARTRDEKDAFYLRQAAEDIRRHPGIWARNLGCKTWQFFSSREIPRNLDLYVVRDESHLLRALVWKIGRFGFPFGLLFGLAVVGPWARRRAAGALLAAIFAYAAAIIAVHVCGRYRIPVIPLFIVLGSFGILALADALRARRFKSAALQFATFLFLAIASSVGGPFCAERLESRGEFYRLLAVTAYENRDYSLAEDCALRALAEDPHEAQAWNQLGLLAVHRGDLPEAERHFQRAVQDDPRCFPAWFNLGKAAAKRGATADAIARFREGLRLSPAYLPAWIELGDLLMAAGQPEEARDCYREVLRIRPGFAPALQRLGGRGLIRAVIHRARPVC